MKPPKVNTPLVPKEALFVPSANVLPVIVEFNTVSDVKSIVPVPLTDDVNSPPFNVNKPLFTMPFAIIKLLAFELKLPDNISNEPCVIVLLFVITPDVFNVPSPSKIPVLFVPFNVKTPLLVTPPSFTKFVSTVIEPVASFVNPDDDVIVP